MQSTIAEYAAVACNLVGSTCGVRLRTHSQNMMVAARPMAERKTVGHLS